MPCLNYKSFLYSTTNQMSFELFKQSFLTSLGYSLAFVTTMKFIEIIKLFKNNYNTSECESCKIKRESDDIDNIGDGPDVSDTRTHAEADDYQSDSELVSKPDDVEYKKLLDKMSRY
jgi:hypothetical protein